MSAQDKMMIISDQPPAIACSLKGAYLIEASAGTGKTWTLTGIILRLLIEEKHAPERIIATTFTRAAATEMQERIQERLVVFYRYVLWLKSKQQSYAKWFTYDDLSVQERDDIIQEIIHMAADANIEGADDPINVHLVAYLLSQDAQAFDDVIRRVGLLLATLDKLFVGTLDSLAQKWLKEFSAEIGHQPQAEILYDSHDITTAIIHDSLRQEHAQVMINQPKLYDIIHHQHIFGAIDEVRHSVNTAMQFFGAPIDDVTPVDDESLEVLQMALAELGRIDLSQIQPFFEPEYRADVGMTKNRTFSNHLDGLPLIIELINEYGLGFVNRLSTAQKKWIGLIFDTIDKDNLFNAKHDDHAKCILMDFIHQYLAKLAEIYAKIVQIAEQYRTNLYRKIALDVRTKTPIWLENQHKTTFTVQMDRLNQALKNSPNLARHIRHHYPVALIDESQDVNGAQVELIRQVYLSNLTKGENKRGFVLLVGDPKQAIYRFRGGDVSNYNYMKNLGKSQNAESVLNQQLTLTVNRRSNKTLIDALNQWFLGDEHANLGAGIYYQHITAHNQTQRLSWQQSSDALPSYLGKQPLAMLHLAKDTDADDVHQLLAWHINSLLQGGHSIGVGQDKRAIAPKDIAVLGAKSDTLTSIKAYLDALNIPSVAARELNVFTTQAGLDIYALLTACVEAGNAEKLGRFLTSDLFNFSLDEAMSVLENDSAIGKTSKSDVLIYLAKMLDRWQKYGIVSALNFALSSSPVDEQGSLWLNMAVHEERYLADVWQIVELVGAYEHLQPLALIDWYEVQMRDKSDTPDAHKRRTLPSESGVNLMTIHKSKGLEFPIVYVLGLDDAVMSRQNGFYPYSGDDFIRRISPTPHRQDELDYYKNLDNQESIDEKKRLGYVALTRASEQMYVVGRDLSSKRELERRPLFLWCEAKDKTLSLPDRMQGHMDWLNLNADDFIKTPYQTNDAKLCPIPYQDWYQVMPQAHFEGVYQTSFTALIGQFGHKNQTMFGDTLERDELEMVNVNELSDATLPDDDIRMTFMRGVLAGDFLHQVLQKVDCHGTPKELLQGISKTIDQVARQLGLYEYMSHDAQKSLGYELSENKNSLHRQLLMWMYDVIHAPFAASGATLASLTSQNSAKEMGFLLGLKQGFDIADLNRVFAEYSDKQIVLDPQEVQRLYRYLKGEIDLVYEKDGRFFVLDYKSNFLGKSLIDYQAPALEATMTQTGYWLQAAIYQVALHRLLKLRIADYVGNERRYLGAVEYLFLRGATLGDEMGRVVWDVPLSLVQQLDELFG